MTELNLSEIEKRAAIDRKNWLSARHRDIVETEIPALCRRVRELEARLATYERDYADMEQDNIDMRRRLAAHPFSFPAGWPHAARTRTEE